jgi:aspartate ammonia-lyase
VIAFAAVKQAAAEANQQLGQLETKIADAIIAACVEIRSGSLHDQFVVDEIQGGAGTSTNMNANEVIANRALEILGTTGATTMLRCAPSAASRTRSFSVPLRRRSRVVTSETQGVTRCLDNLMSR